MTTEKEVNAGIQALAKAISKYGTKSEIGYCEVCGKEAEYDSEMILCDEHEVDAELRPPTAVERIVR